MYQVGDGFYIDNVPQTGLNLFQVTENTYWVDDSESIYYNQRVEGMENKDWNSAEHMIDYYPAYKYGFVIEFNTTNIIPEKGSAIFFIVAKNQQQAVLVFQKVCCLHICKFLVLKSCPLY